MNLPDPAADPPTAAARELAAELKQAARKLGFSLAGICVAHASPAFHRLNQWLDAGYDGEMAYLRQRRAAYEHPRGVLPGVRSLLMLGWNYRTVEPAELQPGQGRVARYALATVDYHDLLHDRLRQLKQLVLRHFPQAAVRGVVDSAPLLEREYGRAAGLGWIGKNTLLLNREAGSWFFLAALLTDLPLPADEPFTADHCGSCRACLDACPTQAFPQPYLLDARRCISYATIEHRGPLTHEWHDQVGDWVFGCDICQEVCPWNRRVAVTEAPDFTPHPLLNPLELVPLFSWDEAEFRRQFRRLPLWRVKRAGLLRNAALVLGRQRPPGAAAALELGSADVDPLVRAASIWALAQFSADIARPILQTRQTTETDPQIREDLTQLLTLL
ncbi:MAG: tRNA epoxyqueuosine(34) reductase QueG [Planctomycetota bacterium]